MYKKVMADIIVRLIVSNLYFGYHVFNLSHPNPVDGAGKTQDSKYFGSIFKFLLFFPWSLCHDLN